MPSEKRPRPSFTPPESTSTSPEEGSTGWVYRSDAPAAEGPEAPASGVPATVTPAADARSRVRRWAGAIGRGTGRGASAVVTTVARPFEYLFLVTIPATPVIAWPLGQSRRPSSRPS